MPSRYPRAVMKRNQNAENPAHSAASGPPNGCPSASRVRASLPA